MFTEIQRKRKSDNCQSLGKKFKPMQNQTHPKIIYLKILKLFRRDIGAEIFTNPQKTGAALTRPRRAGVAGARATNTITNGKSTDWGKRNFSDLWHQYTRIRKVCE